MEQYSSESIKKQFPIFGTHPGLVYLDTAATSQKPESVLETLSNFYRSSNSNVHRGLYSLSESATVQYENSRKTVASHINAKSSREVIFTRGTTEALNLLAFSLSDLLVREGDTILVSELEHHSNFVPWQQAARRKGAKFLVLPLDKDASLDMDFLDQIERDGRAERISLVATGHVSNAFGTINPVKTLSAWCRKRNIPLILDAAQSVPHTIVDVQDLGIDFLAFSGHKAYGPMGAGILWGKEEWLEKMQPWQSGGEMISSVRVDKSTWNEIPHKFEAGTPDVAAAIGLDAALNWINNIGIETLKNLENSVGNYLYQRLGEIDGLTMYGSTDPQNKVGIYPFNIDGIHGHDVAQYLDRFSIAVRSGHHCTQPAMRSLSIPSTVRISLGPYITKSDVDTLIDALSGIRAYFSL